MTHATFPISHLLLFFSFRPPTHFSRMSHPTVFPYLTFYSVLSEGVFVTHSMQQQKSSERRMVRFWNDANDVLIVSQRAPTGGFVTYASPSIRTITPSAALAAQWTRGKAHADSGKGVAAYLDEAEEGAAAAGAPASGGVLRCSSIEELVCAAWHRQCFVCEFDRSGQGEWLGEGSVSSFSSDADGAAKRECFVGEVRATVSETLSEGLLVVVRDCTERVRRELAEKEVLSAAIARQRDEEANRFSRHEVKNSVLAAITQCDNLRKQHMRALGESIILDHGYGHSVKSQLTDMRSGLSETLQAVLSQAMAREVVHGDYGPRPEMIRLDEALLLGGNGQWRGANFTLRTTPRELPPVYMDAQLLLHIYRNAMSNAFKYGKRDSVVVAEVELAVDDILSLRVINAPGSDHDLLLALEHPEVVFEQGTRLHRPRSTAALELQRGSSGDGAWIMQKCAQCLGGRCTISFERERTVFELVCPAPRCRDVSPNNTFRLGACVWAIGVDDCELQRQVLAQIFSQCGVPTQNMLILGDDADDLEQLSERLVSAIRALPATGRMLVVVDENLDLPGVTATTISGSVALQKALEAVPELESRLLALIRSANDSARDLSVYHERAHGFLSKAPAEPEAHTLIQAWKRRFGAAALEEHERTSQ